jgi:hypothetical protein
MRRATSQKTQQAQKAIEEIAQELFISEDDVQVVMNPSLGNRLLKTPGMARIRSPKQLELFEVA